MQRIHFIILHTTFLACSFCFRIAFHINGSAVVMKYAYEMPTTDHRFVKYIWLIYQAFYLSNPHP